MVRPFKPARRGQSIRKWARAAITSILPLRNIRGDESKILVREGSGGLELEQNQPDPEEVAFGWEITAPDVVRIYTGSVILDAVYDVAETDVTLTGDPEFVYVEWVRSTPSGATIQHSTTRPEPTTTHQRVALLKLSLLGGVYVLDKVLHTGDIQFDLPMI